MPPSHPVTFLYTNSFDGTADLVVRELGAANVFRCNFDLWADYRLRIGPGDFEISNPAGRLIGPEDVAKVYWRKPMPSREIFPERSFATEEVYAEEEIWYALRDLVNLLWEQGKVVLVEPFPENRVGKFVQMRVAADLFQVPPWQFLRGAPEYLAPKKEAVVKSLTLNRVAPRGPLRHPGPPAKAGPACTLAGARLRGHGRGYHRGLRAGGAFRFRAGAQFH